MLKHRSVSCASELANADYYLASLEAEYADARAQVAALQTQLREETHALARRAESSEGAMADLRTELASVTEELEQLRLEKRTLLRQIKSERREQTWFESEDRDRVASLLDKIREAEDEAARESAARAALETSLKACLDEMSKLRAQLAELSGATKENLALNQLCERQTSHIKELKEQLESLRISYTAVTLELDAATSTPVVTGCPSPEPSATTDVPATLQTPTPAPPSSLPRSTTTNTNPFKELASARFSAGSLFEEPAAPVFGQIYDRVAGPGGGLASHTPLSPPSARRAAAAAATAASMYLAPLDIRRSLRSEMRRSRCRKGESAPADDEEVEGGEEAEDEVELFDTALRSPSRSNAAASENGKTPSSSRSASPNDAFPTRRPAQCPHHCPVAISTADDTDSAPSQSSPNTTTTPTTSTNTSLPASRRLLSPTLVTPPGLFLPSPSSPTLSAFSHASSQLHHLHPHHPHSPHLFSENNTTADNDPHLMIAGSSASSAYDNDGEDEEEGLLNGGTALLSLLWKLKEWVVPAG
ncbi:hypothetical protein HDU86_008465 [Geranomyces michiganensis]|nr:hypothetical protein HDU86_008465 [Geranomyces michiganensis]